MKKNKSHFTTTEDLANKMYNPSDYQGESTIEKGLAVTHEQVSDCYAEGTIDAVIDDYDGEEDREIPREGYENMFNK